jgi:hypothetical protein
MEKEEINKAIKELPIPEQLSIARRTISRIPKEPELEKFDRQIENHFICLKEAWQDLCQDDWYSEEFLFILDSWPEFLSLLESRSRLVAEKKCAALVTDLQLMVEEGYNFDEIKIQGMRFSCFEGKVEAVDKPKPLDDDSPF